MQGNKLATVYLEEFARNQGSDGFFQAFLVDLVEDSGGQYLPCQRRHTKQTQQLSNARCLTEVEGHTAAALDDCQCKKLMRCSNNSWCSKELVDGGLGGCTSDGLHFFL